MDFDSSKLLKLTKTLTNPSLTLTFSNMAPPWVGPTWIFKNDFKTWNWENFQKIFKSKLEIKSFEMA